MNPSNTNQEISAWYDSFWKKLENEKQAGINTRHRYIFKKLLEAGLTKNAHVLEIGCGSGALTGYIAKKLKKGFVTGVDISSETIENAKKHYRNLPNIEFLVSDLENFNPNRMFDVILFPDVLEHIPVKNHQSIFKTLVSSLKDDGIIAINIPNPIAIRWFIKNKPEALQIIDQDIETTNFVNILYPLGFFLFRKETYSIFLDKPDYDWLVFKKNVPYSNLEFISKFKLLKKSLLLRLSNF